MFAEKVGVILEKYKTGLKARPRVGSLGLLTLDACPKKDVESICEVSVLVRIKFSYKRKTPEVTAVWSHFLFLGMVTDDNTYQGPEACSAPAGAPTLHILSSQEAPTLQDKRLMLREGRSLA